MKGYKGMDKDMRCRDMQYELGKAYFLNDRLELCHNGFHFCTNLRDVFMYYPPQDNRKNRYFEIEAKDQLTKIGENKNVTSAIKIVRELDEVEVNRAIYGDGEAGIVLINDYGDGENYGDGEGNGNTEYAEMNNRDISYWYGIGNGDGEIFVYSCGNGDGYGEGIDNEDAQQVFIFN